MAVQYRPRLVWVKIAVGQYRCADTSHLVTRDGKEWKLSHPDTLDNHWFPTLNRAQMHVEAEVQS